MLVKEIMNKNTLVCTEDTSLEKVFELMTEHDADCVSVVESSRHRIPIGTITEHDICLRLIGKNRNPRGMRALNVMNTKIIKAIAELSLNECLNLMKIKDTEHLSIVDAEGMLCGTISRTEIEKFTDRSVKENKISEKVNYYYNAPGINRIF
jgi:CBS domain-containing protein